MCKEDEYCTPSIVWIMGKIPFLYLHKGPQYSICSVCVKFLWNNLKVKLHLGLFSPIFHDKSVICKDALFPTFYMLPYLRYFKSVLIWSWLIKYILISVETDIYYKKQWTVFRRWCECGPLNIINTVCVFL